MTAYYGDSGPTPLVPREISMAMRRRLIQLGGLALCTLGTLIVLSLITFDANDPSHFTASGQAPANWLGLPGATLSALMLRWLGIGAAGLPVMLIAWGLRVTFARGNHRIWARLPTIALALLLLPIFASTHVPWQDWPLRTGLGGILGDRAFVALFELIPLEPVQSVQVQALVLGLATVAAWVLGLGIDRREGMAFLRWLSRSTVQAVTIIVRRTGEFVWLIAAGVFILCDKFAVAVKEALARPRSERLAPAEPTGSWRRGGGDATGEVRGALPEVPPVAPPRTRRVAPGAGANSYPAPEPPAEVGYRDQRFEPVPTAPAGTKVDLPSPPRVGVEIPVDTGDPLPEAGASETGASETGAYETGAYETGARGAARHRAEPPESEAPAGGGLISRFFKRRGPAEEVPDPLAPDRFRGLDEEEEAPGVRFSQLHRQEPVLEPPAPEPVPDGPVDDERGLSAAIRALKHGDPAKILAGNAREAADPVTLDDDPASKPPISRTPGQVRKSRRAEREAQPGLFDEADPDAFAPPPLGLLQAPGRVARPAASDIALEENARMLETVLEDYGVRGEIVAVKPGPVVTLYELEPAPGLKASRVIGLADDIARSMSALATRVSTVPGRSIIGIELPNTEREKVLLRDMFEAPAYGDARFPLTLALGKDIEGTPVVANLAKMPHLLIAGTTGSGKSVAINTMILSLLYRLSPKQCRLIMIDPKMLELSVYDGIPHLMAPVVTDPKRAIVALKWVVAEMEERYRRMSKLGVRNIDNFNARVREALEKGEDFSRVVQTGFDDETGEPVYETETFEPEEMPFIVVIVDEMADLMMVAGKEIEACIQRLAQMARASGIHLIMATQRPSVDVITGTIKANFPTRISFQVTSKIDSRTILGEQGAEQLLGMGDMLYMAGGGRIRRVHGPFVSDQEVEEVVRHLKAMGPPDYVSGVTEGADDEAQALVDEKLGLGGPDTDESHYDRAVAIVARDRKCSTSYIQRKLGIGYNRAARLVEQMEAEGVVSPANAVGKREILIEER